MARKIITDGTLAPPVAPYCHAQKVGDTIYISGAVSTDRNGEVVGRGDIRVQTRTVMDNIKKIIAHFGADLDDVVKMTVFICDWRDYRGYNEVYGEYFSYPYPARSTFQSTFLAQPGLLIEIEGVAVVGAKDKAEAVVSAGSLWKANN